MLAEYNMTKVSLYLLAHEDLTDINEDLQTLFDDEVKTEGAK